MINYREKVTPRKWFTEISLPLAMKILRLMRGKQIPEKCQCGNFLFYGWMKQGKFW